MYLSLKTLRPLFSIAPMLKSETATMLNTSRSYSRPKARSSQRIARLSGSSAESQRSSGPGPPQIASFTPGLDAGGIGGEHVGGVEEISDATKSFRRALRAVGAARPVKAHQLRVRRRI